MYLLSTQLLGINFSETGLALYKDYLETGNLDYALEVASGMSPPFYAAVLSWISDFSHVFGGSRLSPYFC